jgi:hypothetical protein
MIAGTKLYKKITFPLLFAISIVTAISFYYQITVNFFWGALFAVGGIAIEFFRVLMRGAIQNKSFRNRKKKKKETLFFDVSLYILMSFVACLSTFFVGIVQIEKKSIIMSPATIEINQLKKKADLIKRSADRNDEAINNVMLQTNVNQWALIRLLKEKKEIYSSVGEAAEIEGKIAELEKDTIGVKSGFTIVASVIGNPEASDLIMIIVLLYFSVMLEVGIYYTAPTFSLPQKKKKRKLQPRDIKHGQQLLFNE